jgi:5-methylcytosine-specific restriction endonuclease McrA
MPRAITCILQGREISVDEAIRIKNAAPRDGKKRLGFTCIECGQPVGPHQSRTGHTPHFEHSRRNAACSLSHKMRRRALERPETYPIDDPRAIEGHARDREVLQYRRNPQIAEKRKRRDNYQCAACGFRLEVAGRFVIECHHLKPVAQSGVREVHIDELVSLCPTCHRIAHTRREPLSVGEIKELRGTVPPAAIRTRRVRSNRSFNTDLQRRPAASRRSLPPVAG